MEGTPPMQRSVRIRNGPISTCSRVMVAGAAPEEAAPRYRVALTAVRVAAALVATAGAARLVGRQVAPGLAAPARDGASAETPDRSLLLASHGLVGWYSTADGRLRHLHAGEGIYYGIVPAGSAEPPEPPLAADAAARALESFWVVSRRHNVGSDADVASL